MKKRKTYEISVIDRTYSKTFSDETKFYTSDTALELVFKLKETEYTFESSEIVLLNIDDRSLVTRPVSKVNNDFVYELDDDIIPHYGEWHGQLRFEAGETYVSSPVKFRIENDLSNDRPPQLSDVQSWVSLKRYADGLVDELKQAVLSVDELEDTFNENETVRQSQFETAEQTRQDTFETNESERAEAFGSNETTRQSQELEREKAEVKRQSVFDGNEANRTETFNTNEATRQLNETSRQQAENQRQSTFETNESERQTTFETAEQTRQSAEQERVSAEEQRKTDHANRSSEFDGKADKVIIKNTVENGDFSDGVSEWVAVEGTLFTDTDGVVYNSTISIAIGSRIYQPSTVPIGDIVYASFSIKRSIPKGVYLRLGNLRGDNFIHKSPSDYFSVSLYGARVDNQAISLYFLDTTEGEAIHIKDANVINLTKDFGAGNEPTKEEMDELIKVTGYIDGEYALNNKEMLGRLMKGIREKADKKQEDWITPTLLNGWTNRVPTTPVRFRKNEFGTVEIEGAIKGGTLGVPAFVLPKGYRVGSYYPKSFGAPNYDGLVAEVVIASGNFTIVKSSTTIWISLEGISYEPN